MWKRNLLFAAACLAGLAALQAVVFPRLEARSRQVVWSDPAKIAPVVAAIDAAMTEDWMLHNLEPAPVASDLQIARRLSLALAGTIPSLEEIRLFERQDPDRRLEWWLGGILADRRYADYVGERLARAFVGVEDGPFLLYRRRRFVSWLADQFSENAPYDQIVRHLISDSGLWTDTPATNFITVTIKPNQRDEGPDEKQLAARVARGFLGVRLDCAECHDHPFDRWRQSDFHSLAAFFGETGQSLRGIRDMGGKYQLEDARTGKSKTIQPDVPFQENLVPINGGLRHRLASWVTNKQNKAFARTAANRAWGLLFGRPLVEPIDNIPTRDDGPEALDILAEDFVANNYDWQRLLRTIAATRAFRTDSALPEDSMGELTAEHTARWAAFPLVRLRPEQVVGGLSQASSLSTIDYQSHILVRLARGINERDFIERYGDSGADEFEPHGGTIPQRLLMMNGRIVRDKTRENVVLNAATRIALLAPGDTSAVETAYLAVLTRRPTSEEAEHFAARLSGKSGNARNACMEDLYWTLLNTTEFSWGH